MPSPPPAVPPGRRRPPGRYDEPSRAASRTVAVTVAVLLVGFLVALAWAMYQRLASDAVPVQVRGFTVVGDDLVRVEFAVTPPAGATAWCLVRARNAGGEEVGRAFVAVPSSGTGDSVRVVHDLVTRATAVSGEVQRCRTTPPPATEPTARPSP